MCIHDTQSHEPTATVGTESMTGDILIVGGGIAGLSAAHELSPDHDVTVLERDRIAGGATGHASGLVTVVADYAERREAARYSIEFFREFDGTGQFSFHERPFVQLRTTPELSGLREEAADFRDDGFDVTAHDGASLADRYPDVFDASAHTGAVVFEDAGWVDPYTYATTLADEAMSEGAEIRTNTEVTELIVDGGTVCGVRTDDGEVRADRVVVAAGWRTPELAGVDLPVRPFRYQTANLETGAEIGDYPIAWDQESRLYWRPEHNGDLHVGGGAYYVSEPGTIRSATVEGFKRLVAGTIPDRLPALTDARLATDDTCPSGDAATPDHLPIIDSPSNGPAGLVVATGLHGFGIMAGPAVGRAIRAHVADEDAPFPLEPYRADRFDPNPSWEFPYIAPTAAETGP
ncbi:FAD dependent oxidoreductase [Natrialba hulunbeirensis JCM 10989]|uniref:FAD dependent oxidoreductase n=1 Tax=Natrialba hulunbeirensis JCM 10989 TaxID=1227493 RepID=L9ZZC2_9EURY|nr:FAD-binding oxidoreductase [Natrialba hulunbeirensis]ELY91694.1 FAD dependent oxidoreductase [Natrialba hulunbeirensis JCM 10989]